MKMLPATAILTHEEICIAIVEWLDRRDYKRAGIGDGKDATPIIDDVYLWEEVSDSDGKVTFGAKILIIQGTRDY